MSDPVSEKYGQMNAVAAALAKLFNGDLKGKAKEVAFVVLIDGGRVNYISNGPREDIVTMLKEILARFEGQPEQRGTS